MFSNVLCVLKTKRIKADFFLMLCKRIFVSPRCKRGLVGVIGTLAIVCGESLKAGVLSVSVFYIWACGLKTKRMKADFFLMRCKRTCCESSLQTRTSGANEDKWGIVGEMGAFLRLLRG